MSKCDVWSLGVLASVMFYGRYPFKNVGVGKDLRHWEDVVIPEENEVPKEINYLVTRMLQVNMEKRARI